MACANLLQDVGTCIYTYQEILLDSSASLAEAVLKSKVTIQHNIFYIVCNNTTGISDCFLSCIIYLS